MSVRHLRRTDTAGLPEDYDLPANRYGFGVSWDACPNKVDIDLQCVVIDKSGTIIDCCYYNNLKAVGAITHSGDETTGAVPGIDEYVWISMDRLPENVALLLFVVAAYSGGKLQDAKNGTLHVLENTNDKEIARFRMEESPSGVDVVSAMYQGPRGWTMRIIEEPGQQGQHFMDILPLLAQVIRGFLPNAPSRQKVAFAMEKGGAMDFPQSMDAITIGLGWDVATEGIDLDVSAVLLDAHGGVEEVVFFAKLQSTFHGVKHSGDNLTGEGDGDDEQIQARLSAIGPDVQQLVFVINIYTKDVTFDQVSNPYCRVVDDTGAELCRYMLNQAGRESGLIVSSVAREAGNRWGFHAIGQPCRGRTHKDSLPEIKQLCCSAVSAAPSDAGARSSEMVRVPADVGKWTCNRCGEINRLNRPVCNSCGAPQGPAATGGGYADELIRAAAPPTATASRTNAGDACDVVAATVRRLDALKANAAANEDYQLAARLKDQLAEVQKLAERVTALEHEKHEAAAQEDFEKAAAAKQSITAILSTLQSFGQ